ncbi:MAG: 6-hydroxymethylpterin diphosphokinase MptE-like protein [bacterium]
MSYFEANLKSLEKHNPLLAKDLKSLELTAIIEKFAFKNSKNGEINLFYQNLPIHDNESPINEAKVITGFLQDSSDSSITILLGLGIGYLLKECFNSISGKIIIFEPNIEILKFSLEAIDFSELLDSERVFITSDFAQLTLILQELYSLDSKIHLNGLTSFKLFNPDLLEVLSAEINETVSELNANFSTLFDKAPFWAVNSVKNIKNIIDKPDILALDNIFLNKPAVIVSPGPSLDDYIEDLKANKDKVVIFATGNSAKTLINNGIEPNFICFIDNNDNTAQVSGIDVSNINLIAQPTAHNNVFNINSKRKYVYFTENDLFSRWMKTTCNFDLPKYDSKGTVSYCAFVSAVISGCNPIILLGQDLAYTNNKCYATSSAYGGLKVKCSSETGEYELDINNKENLIKHYVKDELMHAKEDVLNYVFNQVRSKLDLVKGQHGELLPTDTNYKSFIKYFEEFALTQQTSIKLYNSSIGGAQIDGFENKPISQILSDFSPLGINIDEVISNSSDNYKLPLQSNLSTLKAEIAQTKEMLLTYVKKAETLVELCINTEKEVKSLSPNVNLIRQNSNVLIEEFFEFQEGVFYNNNFLTYPVFKELAILNNLINSEELFDDLIRFCYTHKAFYTKFITEYEQIIFYLEDI